jgi:hypothetical protein
MDNSEKLATLGSQEKQNKTNHNTKCVGQYYTQTNTNNVNKGNKYVLEYQSLMTYYSLQPSWY